MTPVGVSYDVAVAETQTVRRRRRRRSRSKTKTRHNTELDSAIFGVSQKLVSLASLGRRGQYVLHHEEIYDPEIDTRPQSRNHEDGTEIPISSIICSCCGRPLQSYGLTWAGWLEVDTENAVTTQRQTLSTISFWNRKNDELSSKIEQIRTRYLHAEFTEDELQTLEALEQQPGHFFRIERARREKSLVNDKMTIFNMLFQFPKYGRAGQWVLHHLELYHPAIDTRPQTRSVGTDVILCDEIYNGEIRFMGTGNIPAALELMWCGNGPPPGPDDTFFWQETCKDISDKLFNITQGLVKPQFTSMELRQLCILEADPDHAFGIYAYARNEQFEVPYTMTDTPETLEAKKQLWIAMYRVVLAMEALWESGLAGKWVLHNQEIFLASYDTHCRGNQMEPTMNAYGGDPDSNESRDPNTTQMEYISLFHDRELGHLYHDPYMNQYQPDFRQPSYWKQKLAYLKQLADDVSAGRLREDHFSEGELMRIELLERTLQYQRDYVEPGDEPPAAERASNRITGWLDNMEVYAAKDSGSAAWLSPTPTLNASSPSTSGGTSRPASFDNSSDVNDDRLTIPDTNECAPKVPVSLSKIFTRLRPRPTKPSSVTVQDDIEFDSRSYAKLANAKGKKKRHLYDARVHKPTRKSARLRKSRKRN